MSKKKSLTPLQHADIEALRAKVARRREYLALLETELANTRILLQEFTDLYNARVAPLENEYARLQQMFEKLTAFEAPPESEWKGRVEGKRGHHGSPTGPSTAEEEAEAREAAKKDPEYERKIRDLFHQLAKQYHPDLAHEDDEKKRRAEIMAAINRAYTEKDLDALEAIAKQHDPKNPANANSPETELVRLTMELRQLESMVFEVEHAIRQLDLSPAMQMRSEMKGDRESGRDYLRGIERDFKARILDLQDQLIGLGVEIEFTQPEVNNKN
jgi:hypothetical protein